MTKVKCCYCGEEMEFGKTYSNINIPEAIGHKYCVMAYCNQLGEQKMAKHKVKLVLGDWSKDGHEKSKEVFYESNYPLETIQQAYRDSCALTGVQFHYDSNGSRTWKQIFVEYGNSHIEPEAVEVLKEHGLDPTEYSFEICDEGCNMPFDTDGAADLIMAFIKLSMPKDWTYSTINNDIPAINGWWGKLNHSFGYGLFD